MTDWIQSGAASLILSPCLGAVGFVVALRARKQLRETTLILPWYWTVVSLIAVTAGEVAVGWAHGLRPPQWSELVRYFVAVSTLLPLVSALGAKRPQHKAWQFIVLSLWGVLVLPVAQAVFLQPGRAFEVHGAWSWFLLLLIALGVVNFVATRFWLSSLLLAGGQCLLLGPFLPFRLGFISSVGVWGGFGLCVLALVVAALIGRRRHRDGSAFSRLWRDFRDWFGAMWALRVAERIHAAAEMHDWNVVLRWGGFRRIDESAPADDIPSDVAPALRRTMVNLLRRFVSRQWIAARLDDGDE